MFATTMLLYPDQGQTRPESSLIQAWELFLVSAAYVAVLFGVAFYGDRRSGAVGARARKPWVYSLALGVYCTSWTFYGAVGRAAGSGWDFMPIYLGPMLIFVFGTPLLRRIVHISKRHNITSIADFIGARYGRHQKLAMAVTLIAVIGVLPYIALQIKAVAFSFEVLAGPSRAADADYALLISLLLAVFAILFGTRQVVSSENHHGMMLAIAFESVCKLLAFLAVGLFAAYGIFDGIGDAYRHALALAPVADRPSNTAWQIGFVTQTLLAAAAVICLPRQFHVTVVENTGSADLKTARWLFPFYLGLISLFVLPIMAAGTRQLPPGTSADTFVLAIPLAADKSWLALVAYLGGFSAATSMVIVATIALSTMLCNEVVMPLLFRAPRLGLSKRSDLSGLLKAIRRVTILALVMVAYGYYRLFSGPGMLSTIGLLSFSAVLHFLPSLVIGLYWRRANYEAALGGMLTGFIFWCYGLMLPMVLTQVGMGADLLANGPLGVAWLRPGALFGLGGLDLITQGTLVSLAAHLVVFCLVSLRSAPGLRERVLAGRFLEPEALEPSLPQVPQRISATVGDLQTLLERFFGVERARSLIAEYGDHARRDLRSEERAEPELARFVEHLLAGAVGAASARLVLASTLQGRDMQLEDVVRVLDEASLVIQFNRDLLRAALEHLSQGLSVVDRELRLVAWNRRYLEFFDYPPELITVGRPIEDVLRYNVGRGLIDKGDIDAAVTRRLEHMRAGHAYTHRRTLMAGTVVEIRGNPMPGGGFVTSYSDVTAYVNSERALQEANETLESRVRDRTRELTDLNRQLGQAKLTAERADDAKTRFLASASHDLVQPLNAARLFMASIDRGASSSGADTLLAQAEHSLSVAEGLLTGLLDISRLDANAQPIRIEDFELKDLVEPLAAEFRALAGKQGLRFDFVPTNAVIRSDPRLLRRVLQNVLSNAVRYTVHGRVVLGCRRAAGALRIEVWDTGPGIAIDKREEIFEEFRRLNAHDARGERGLGLGLAIVQRVARMLEHPLSLRSWPGRGSVFSVTVPLGERSLVRPPSLRASTRAGGSLAGARVLCIENEPAVLAGMEALLGTWDCVVIPAADEAQARERCQKSGGMPDLLLIDYHLDGNCSGVDVATNLVREWGQAVPGIVLTADHTPRAHNDAQAHGYSLLPKPVKPAALRALMSRMLSQQKISKAD